MMISDYFSDSSIIQLEEDAADYAAALAQHCDADIGIVRKVVERLYRYRFERDENVQQNVSEQEDQSALSQRDSFADWLGLRRFFRKAFAYHSDKWVAQFFEEVNFATLSRRLRVLNGLSDSTVPLYTARDLANITDDLINHLELNRSSLIETGFPRTRFDPSAWVDTILTPLLYTKLPISVFNRQPNTAELPVPVAPERSLRFVRAGLAPCDAYGNIIYSYYWAGERGKVFWAELDETPHVVKPHELGVNSSIDITPLRLSTYQEAVLIEGLTPREAARMERARTALLDAKLDVLRVTTEALRTRNDEKLWEDVFGILTRAFNAEEAQALIALDRKYAEHLLNDVDVLPFDLECKLPSPTPGSVSALLGFVAHCAEEVNIGIYDEFATKVKEIKAATGGSLVDSYAQALGHHAQSVFDDALDTFERLTPTCHSFVAEIESRLHKMIEREFYQRIELIAYAKPEHASLLRPLAQAQLDSQVRHLEVTGVPSQRGVEAIEGSANSRTINLFRKRGNTWEISYGGRGILLKDMKGLLYLWYLLQRPHEEVSAAKLSSLERHTPGMPNPGGLSDHSAERLAAEGLIISGQTDADKVLDAQAINSYRRCLEIFVVEAQQAEETGDDARLAEIEEKRRIIEQELKATNRKFATISNKMRDAVSHCVIDALKKIKSVHPGLAEHLAHRSGIRTGFNCSYTPDEPTEWQFE